MVSAVFRICLALAALKVVGGCIAFAALARPENVPARPVPDFVFVLHIVVFSAVGALLIYASRSDRRAAYLGVSFWLVASSFSDPLTRRLPELLPATFGSWGSLLSALQPEAMLPFFLWLFFRDFPRSLAASTTNRIFRIGLRLSLYAGIALFVANVALFVISLIDETSGLVGLLQLFERKARVSYFWTVLFALELPVLPLALWRSRKTALQERRRFRLFLIGLGIGSVPMMLEVILEVVFPSFKAMMSIPSNRLLGGLILYPLLLSVPFTTAYAILVQHVLDARVIVRLALRYALARYAALALTALPFVLIFVYLYQHRQETISSVMSGYGLVLLAGVSIIGAVAFLLRNRLFNAIDRRYFREHYDSRTILSDLVERSRATGSIEELAALLQVEIDRALHLESVAVLVIEPREGQLRSPNHEIRSLSSSSALLGIAEGSTDPLDVDLENPRSLLQRFSQEDRQWLADGAFRLLVPLIASDGRLIGLIALGGKKSELRFSREDRMLLQAIAASVALTLENRLVAGLKGRSWRSDSPNPSRRTSLEDELATECQKCHSLQPPRTASCTGCGGIAEASQVPFILLGKFRLERKVGSGGMGVVYRAIDLVLGRAVAIKTLPRVTPEHSMRLRREARAMATVVHPNLALIFGAETWRGTPMLVFEFLDGGTLADRLKTSRSSLDETIQLGMTLANVLERTHAAGILHRDIKPSNIGYTTLGVPKLLDFGLAHVLDDSRSEPRLRQPLTPDLFERSTISLSMIDVGSMTPAGHIVGTPIYLSPERIRNEAPDPSVDLWAVAIVLYEALAGKNPVRKSNLRETFDFITKGPVPDIRGFVPDCPEAMATFLADALANDKARRPTTAADLSAKLQRVASIISSR